MKKIIIPFLILSTIVSGITLVYAGVLNFNNEITFHGANSKNIFSDSEELSSIVVSFTSNSDISDHSIQSSCNIASSFLLRKDDIHYFKLSLLDQLCENPNFVLKDEKNIIPTSAFSLDIRDISSFFSLIIDYPTEKIFSTKKSLETHLKKYSQFEYINEISGEDIIGFMKKQRTYKELEYKNAILRNILERREKKYSIPVKGHKISTDLNLIPNADRHYRKDYTDGIHHGWDIMAPEGTPVSAIDDGVIVRVVRDFSYEDLSNIKRGPDLSHSDKLRNLDILRGNQVWLKTAKGDVMFYSHLKDIFDNIKEGSIIRVGNDIGTIGKSGVPEKGYSNYHLHFPIQKNPYNVKKAGKYSLEDYMNWDWYLRGLEATDVVNGQADIFETD